MKTTDQKLIFHHIDVATTNITFEGCLVEFDEDFEQDVLALPYDNTTSNAISAYTAFIEKYGNSYISSVVLGGRAKKLLWTSNTTVITKLTKAEFLADTTIPLTFQGGDTE